MYANHIIRILIYILISITFILFHNALFLVYHIIVHSTIPLLLHPEYLANYDIVFTKYETFRKDYEMFAASKVRLRHQPKYPMFLSPLFSLHWWRLVLDEMHLVESRQETMKQSSFLSRQNCWCVSGTPFNRDLNEVNASMQLLNEPWFSNQWVWSRLTEVCNNNNNNNNESCYLRFH